MEPFKITLAAARVNAKMSQGDLAKSMHVCRQTIYNWESGKAIPGVPELTMISQILQVPLDYIFLPQISTKSREEEDIVETDNDM